MDSLNKRLKIIQELTETIGIRNIRLCHSRAEDLGQNKAYRETFDLCISRAVANLAVLSEYCIPLVKVGGWFAPYKSGTAEEELKDSLRAIELLGARLEESGIPHIKGYDLDHRILFIKKMRKTISKYPRKAGTPAKEPLK